MTELAMQMVMGLGKLICTYPGPAIGALICIIKSPNSNHLFCYLVDIPNSMTADTEFMSELASFITQMSYEIMDDATPKTKKAGAVVSEERDTAHPRYITELLTGILRGVGHVANVGRINKRIADEVRWHNSFLPWRRSPLWLVIRVAIQTSLHVEGGDHREYKSFMAYFVAKCLQLAVDAGLPSDVLYVMHAKLGRRMYKLQGKIIPALHAVLNSAGNAARNSRIHHWETIQMRHVQSARWAPETLNIQNDTVLSLVNSRSYLDLVLSSNEDHVSSSLFEPVEAPRILSPGQNTKDFRTGAASLKRAILSDKFAGLRDFETSVQLFLDDWVNQRLDGGDVGSYASLAEYFQVYYNAAAEMYKSNAEDQSIMLLTLFEIWMAIDRLATSEIPLMIKYPPEVSPDLLHSLLLRSSTSTQRAACIMIYCHNRKMGAKFGTVFSDHVTQSSFGVCYFKESREMQNLKMKIERNATSARDQKRAELSQLNTKYRSLINQAG